MGVKTAVTRSSTPSHSLHLFMRVISCESKSVGPFANMYAHATPSTSALPNETYTLRSSHLATSRSAADLHVLCYAALCIEKKR